ncbi:MAG: hypothetical protein HRU38_00040 [Saccharospirillaceae bacterium]|nr:hypothetical protein [Pseudomonadales bacterium]NRB77051.1 hypothetical protein [Saccharospirillaceae bacterium]
MNKKLSICLLGFAKHCDKHNQKLAESLGKRIAKLDLKLLVGSSIGTFAYALKSCKQHNGYTTAILQEQHIPSKPELIDFCEYCKNAQDKHQLIAKKADLAVVIGGAIGTQHLIEHLLKQNKPVFVITHTSGICDFNDPRLTYLDNIDEFYNVLDEFIKFG